MSSDLRGSLFYYLEILLEWSDKSSTDFSMDMLHRSEAVDDKDGLDPVIAGALLEGDSCGIWNRGRGKGWTVFRLVQMYIKEIRSY